MDGDVCPPRWASLSWRASRHHAAWTRKLCPASSDAGGNIKLLKPRFDAEQTSHRKRFVDEGRTLARLVHPHVVAVHDAGETPDGLAYLVMELSAAGSLEGELLRRDTLPPEEALRLVLPLMGALACAHDRGIIHRDIKPANVALVREHGKACTKLLDFGIAKHADREGASDAALGTPAYMAPEQARGEALGPQADVWALGVLLFRCLSGSLPFDAGSPAGTLLKLVQGRAPRFSSACRQLSPHLALALDRALEPVPSRRYTDMRSFARAIAVASRQDGLALPQHPEPIGLPDFEKWRAEADLEATQPLEKERSLPAPVRVVSPVSRQLPSSRSKAGRLGLALALAVALVAALTLTHRSEPRATAALKPGKQPVASSAQQPATQPPVPVVAPDVPVPLPALPATNEVKPVRPIARQKRPRPETAAQQTPLQTVVTPVPSPSIHTVQEPGLVKSWDW